MKNRYEILLVDLDDTLIDDDISRKGALREVCQFFNINFSEQLFTRFIEFESKFWKDYEKNKIVMPHFKDPYDEKKIWLRAQRFINIFQVDFEDAVKFDDLYSKCLGNDIVTFDYVHETLEYLSKRYSLCIATNGASISVNKKLQKADLNKYFKYVFAGEDFNTSKPRKDFFEYIMKVLNYFDLSKMAIIGDNMHTDIEGGTNIGIDTYFFNPNKISIPSDIKLTKEFNSLKELIYFL